MTSVMRMWLDEFTALPEYSMTRPTGVCAGKTWKCNASVFLRASEPDWWIGQYVDVNGVIYTKSFRLALLQGPRLSNTKSRFITQCPPNG